MKLLRNVKLYDKQQVPVLISDEVKVLNDALSAGMAVIAIINGNSTIPVGLCRYALTQIEDINDIDEDFLYTVACRHLNLPLMLSESERIYIREFKPGDFNALSELSAFNDDVAIFTDRDLFISYIKNRYEFYNYELWAVVEEKRGCLIGTVGFTETDKADMYELSYAVHKDFRQMGYATEALYMVIEYAYKKFAISKFTARISYNNEASKSLILKVKKKLYDNQRMISIFVNYRR